MGMGGGGVLNTQAKIKNVTILQMNNIEMGKWGKKEKKILSEALGISIQTDTRSIFNLSSQMEALWENHIPQR